LAETYCQDVAEARVRFIAEGIWDITYNFQPLWNSGRLKVRSLSFGFCDDRTVVLAARGISI
jgi:hypothetical protein